MKRTAIRLSASTLSVRIGGWFQAQATGWGVVALAVLAAAALAATVYAGS
ncbi:hypothetical protein [Phenylobacterium sp.]|nr:hypothetical protein [Phenylobacterium sp.]